MMKVRTYSTHSMYISHQQVKDRRNVEATERDKGSNYSREKTITKKERRRGENLPDTLIIYD